jgi:hypothetical protein
VKLTRIEKAQQKQKLKAAWKLEISFAADGKKGRRPSSKTPFLGAKGGARLSDHGADLHYGQNNNGFPTARVNSQEPGVDDYGVSDRFDDDGMPELDAETIAGRGRVRPTMKPLYRPRGEGEESDEEGGSDIRNDAVEEIYNNMSTAERERCRESILRHRAERRSAWEEKAANEAAMAKFFPETAAGLDKSGLGATGAAAPSGGNASGGGPSRGNSSGGGANGGNASKEAARGGSRDLQVPPFRGSNASLRHFLRHVQGEEPGLRALQLILRRTMLGLHWF